VVKSRKNGPTRHGDRGNGPVHIASVLDGLVRRCREKADFDLTLLWEIWPAVVDGATAANTSPAAFKGSVLVIHVTSPVWRHHLQFEKQKIIDAVNTALKRRAVTRIKVVVGPV